MAVYIVEVCPPDDPDYALFIVDAKTKKEAVNIVWDQFKYTEKNKERTDEGYPTVYKRQIEARKWDGKPKLLFADNDEFWEE